MEINTNINKGAKIDVNISNGVVLNVSIVSGGGVSSGGSTVSVTQKQKTGINIADIEIDGTTTKLYAPNGGGGGTGGAVDSVNGMTGDVVLTASNISGFATVATSGSYNDLSDKPAQYTLPKAGSALGGVRAANASTADNTTVHISSDGYLKVATPTDAHINSLIDAKIGSIDTALDTMIAKGADLA